MPERQDQRPESGAAEAIIAAESRRIDLSAEVDETVDKVRATGFDGEVQGSPAQVIAAIHQVRFFCEKLVDGIGVAVGDGVMDGVAGAGGGDTKSQLVAQQIRNLVVSSVEGHLKEGFLRVQRAVEYVRPGVQEHARGVQMALAHREVQRRRVPELRPDQGWVVVEHRLQRGGVPVASGIQHLPDRLAAPAPGPVRFARDEFEGAYEVRPGQGISASARHGYQPLGSVGRASIVHA